MLQAETRTADFYDGKNTLKGGRSTAETVNDLGADFWLHVVTHPKELRDIATIIFWKSFDNQDDRIAVANQDEKDKSTLRARVIGELYWLARQLQGAARTRETRLNMLMTTRAETIKRAAKLPGPLAEAARAALSRVCDILTRRFEDERIYVREQPVSHELRQQPSTPRPKPRRPINDWWNR